ncbi:MAG: phosphoribosylformylglycinamidine cyclo-ligase [Actinomycetota bacterium]
MNTDENNAYKRSGVDIEAGDESVGLIKKLAATTNQQGVIGGIGAFAGAFSARFDDLTDPVLISATDGVGTKLLIAQTLGRHDTVGIDAVAMVVDDIVCNGAEPLFLLDYIACGKLVPERIAEIVAGIAEGCRISGCALLGGETAEHPGAMDPDAYDLATFAVGVVDRGAMLGPDRVVEGDVIVGLGSSGLHSNGYSLVRRIILDRDLSLDARIAGADGTLGDELLRPCRIHAPALLAAARATEVHAAAHITGGGIAANLARALPDGLGATLRLGSWQRHPIFTYLGETGEVSEKDMRNVFNLGLGMAILLPNASVEPACEILRQKGETATVIGEVVRGHGVAIG